MGVIVRMSENEGSSQPTEETPQQEAPQPKETLYVSNLNEKVKIEDLKKELFDLFSQHGTVLDIVAIKTYSLRGQAWVVFNSTEEAALALEKLNETDFHEKPLRVQFAKEKSDLIAEREGIPVDKETRQVKKRKKRAEEEEQRAKRQRTRVRAEDNPPNKLLLVQNIPPLDPQIIHEMLTALFSQYAGLKDVRMVPGRGVALVEFENEMLSGRAREGLQGFKVTPEFPLSVSFAK